MSENASSGDCNHDGADLVADACTTVDIADELGSLDIPTAFALHPAYPNPFNPATKIRYDVPQAAEVRLVVYDALGRLVEVLTTRHQAPGAHATTWEARNVPSGVYFVRMEAPRIVLTQRMLLIK